MSLATQIAVLFIVAAALPLRAAAQGRPSGPIPSDRSVEWTVEDAVTAALAQHPLVAAARARAEAAHHEWTNARALPNPIGTVWLENDRPRETSVYLTYPFESILQRGSRVRRADEDVRAAGASLSLARRAVAAETVRAFFSVALAQVLWEEADENRLRLEQLVSYSSARVGEGVTAEGELLRLEIELDRAAHDVVLAEVEFTRSRARLAPYLGAKGSAAGLNAIWTSVPPSAVPAISSIPARDVVLASALTARPEIVSGRARAAAAAASVEYEQSLRVRQIGATFGTKRTTGRSAIVAGVSVAIPLFNVNRAPIARAASERMAADHEREWIEQIVATGVQGAYGAATTLTTELGRLQQTFVARAERVHELTIAAYQEGGATLLQVLDATRMFAEARLTYSRALFAQRESVFDLALATGADPMDALGLLRAWTAVPARASREGEVP
jgi:outer membrane protein TolC